MKRLTRAVAHVFLSIALAVTAVVWVPATAPASTTATITLDFGSRTEVDVTAIFEAQQPDGSWAIAATATGKPKVTASVPVGTTVRMRVDEPTGFYAPGWLQYKAASGSWIVVSSADAATTFPVTGNGSARVDLTAAGVIRGRLVDERGEPLDGVKVTAWRQLVYGGSIAGTTDADGVLEIKGVHPSEYVLYAKDPKERIAGESVMLTGSGATYAANRLTVPRSPDVASFEATLPAGGIVTGTVRRDVDGMPVAGAVIECWQYYSNPQLGPEYRVRTTTTGADGSYRITGLSQATHDLRVGVGWTGDEFPRATPSFTVAIRETLSHDVTMTVGAWVSGSASVFPGPAWSEEPYAPLSVFFAHTYLQASRFDSQSGEFVAQFPSDYYPGQRVEGSFRLRIMPGSYRFSLGGYHLLSQHFPGPEEGIDRLDIAPGETLNLGAVSVPRHTIIRGAAQKESQETWLNSGTVFTLWHKQPDGSFKAVASQHSVDSSGRFRFAGDYSGTFKVTGVTPTPGYRTWAWPDATDLESAQEFEIQRSEYRDLSTKTIPMIAGTLRATVKGLTFDSDGEPVRVPLPGATVVIYKSIGWGPQEVTRVTSGADGSISVKLPEGAYMLRVVDAAGAYSTQDFGFDDDGIYVRADEVADVGDLDLPKKGRMGGWIVSEATGGPIAGVRVAPSNPIVGSLPVLVTDVSGFFETGLIDWDLWDLSVTDPLQRFEPRWYSQMIHPGVGETEYWEFSMWPYEPQIERAAGANRYESCASAVAQSYAYADEVIIATGAAFPDALAGAPLSAASGAPLLLVQPTSVPPAIAKEISRLGATRATILGGAGSVSDSVIDQLVSLGIPRENVRRVAGANRYETASKIALEVYRLNEWTEQDDVTAYVASGSSFADALSASSVAAMEGAPLLLVSATGLPAATKSALAEISPDSTTIVGGTSVVGDAVAAALPGSRRVAGTSRYGTNAALLTEALNRADDSGYAYDGLVVASGRTFPDALVGASICGRRNALLVLVDGTLPDVTRPAVGRLGDGAMSLITMGGSGAVSPATESAVRSYVR